MIFSAQTALTSFKSFAKFPKWKTPIPAHLAAKQNPND